MATTPISSKSLPNRPSEEYLRKEAKRLARGDAIQLAAAQRRLAREYGYPNWAGLINAVQAMASPSGGSSGADPSRVSGSPPAHESGPAPRPRPGSGVSAGKAWSVARTESRNP